MQKKEQKFTPTKIQTDISPTKIKSDSAIKIHNFRIDNNGEDSSTFALTLEKESKKYNYTGPITSVFKVEDNIEVNIKYMFTINSEIICIFYTQEEKNKPETLTSYISLFTDDFQTKVNVYSAVSNIFGENIQATFVYETDKIQKIYWIDNINQPRILNISDFINSNGTLNQKAIAYKNGILDFIPELPNKTECKITKSYTGGEWACGCIQYLISYCIPYVIESNIAWYSSLYYITKDGKGLNPDGKIKSTETFYLKITSNLKDITPNYTHVKVYRLQYSSLDQPQMYDLGYYRLDNSKKLDGNYGLIIKDTGIINEKATPTDATSFKFNNLFYPIQANSFQTKDNHFLVGGYTLHDNYLEETENNSFSISNKENENENLDLKTLLVKNDNETTPINIENTTFFHKNESYNLGVQYMNKYGVWSNVQSPQNVVINNNTTNVELTLNKIPDNQIACRVVCSYNTVDKRNFIAEGAINNSIQDGENPSIYHSDYLLTNFDSFKYGAEMLLNSGGGFNDRNSYNFFSRTNRVLSFLSPEFNSSINDLDWVLSGDLYCKHIANLKCDDIDYGLFMDIKNPLVALPTGIDDLDNGYVYKGTSYIPSLSIMLPTYMGDTKVNIPLYKDGNNKFHYAQYPIPIWKEKRSLNNASNVSPINPTIQVNSKQDNDVNQTTATGEYQYFCKKKIISRLCIFNKEKVKDGPWKTFSSSKYINENQTKLFKLNKDAKENNIFYKANPQTLFTNNAQITLQVFKNISFVDNIDSTIISSSLFDYDKEIPSVTVDNAENAKENDSAKTSMLSGTMNVNYKNGSHLLLYNDSDLYDDKEPNKIIEPNYKSLYAATIPLFVQLVWMRDDNKAVHLCNRRIGSTENKNSYLAVREISGDNDKMSVSTELFFLNHNIDDDGVYSIPEFPLANAEWVNGGDNDECRYHLIGFNETGKTKSKHLGFATTWLGYTYNNINNIFTGHHLFKDIPGRKFHLQFPTSVDENGEHYDLDYFSTAYVENVIEPERKNNNTQYDGYPHNKNYFTFGINSNEIVAVNGNFAYDVGNLPYKKYSRFFNHFNLVRTTNKEYYDNVYLPSIAKNDPNKGIIYGKTTDTTNTNFKEFYQFVEWYFNSFYFYIKKFDYNPRTDKLYPTGTNEIDENGWFKFNYSDKYLVNLATFLVLFSCEDGKINQNKVGPIKSEDGKDVYIVVSPDPEKENEKDRSIYKFRLGSDAESKPKETTYTTNNLVSVKFKPSNDIDVAQANRNALDFFKNFLEAYCKDTFDTKSGLKEWTHSNHTYYANRKILNMLLNRITEQVGTSSTTSSTTYTNEFDLNPASDLTSYWTQVRNLSPSSFGDPDVNVYYSANFPNMSPVCVITTREIVKDEKVNKLYIGLPYKAVSNEPYNNSNTGKQLNTRLWNDDKDSKDNPLLIDKNLKDCYFYEIELDENDKKVNEQQGFTLTIEMFYKYLNRFSNDIKSGTYLGWLTKLKKSGDLNNTNKPLLYETINDQAITDSKNIYFVFPFANCGIVTSENKTNLVYRTVNNVMDGKYSAVRFNVTTIQPTGIIVQYSKKSTVTEYSDRTIPLFTRCYTKNFNYNVVENETKYTGRFISDTSPRYTLIVGGNNPKHPYGNITDGLDIQATQEELKAAGWSQDEIDDCWKDLNFNDAGTGLQKIQSADHNIVNVAVREIYAAWDGKDEVTDHYSKDNVSIPIYELYKNKQLTKDTNVDFEHILWQVCSPIYYIKDIKENKIKATIGDCYYGDYYHILTIPYTKEANNQLVDIDNFQVATHCNLLGIYDGRKDLINHVTTDLTNMNLFNSVYNQTFNFFSVNYLNPKENKISHYYPNQIIYSLAKTIGSKEDNWTKVNPGTGFYDAPGHLGKITNLLKSGDKLYALQERGANYVSFNARIQVSASDGVPIELANSGKLDQIITISETYGCNNYKQSVSTDLGIYFIDSYSNDLCLLKDTQIQDIAKTTFNSSLFKSNNEDYVLFFDKIKQELYIQDQSKNYSILYSLPFQQFLGTFDYNDIQNMINYKDTLIYDCYDDTYLYAMRKGDNYFNNYEISVVNNDELSNLLEAFTFNSSDSSELKSYRIKANALDNQLIQRGNKPFNQISVKNDYQNATHDNKTLIKKLRTWRWQIPRQKRNRIVDRWNEITISNYSNNIILEPLKVYDLSLTYWI